MISQKEQPGEQVLLAGLCPAKQKVSIWLDRKDWGAKAMTVIEGLEMMQEEREILFGRLKTNLGTGGTAGISLEMRGDRRDAPRGALEKMNYRPRHSGG